MKQVNTVVFLLLLPASALLAQGLRGGGFGPMGRGPGMMGGPPSVVTGAPYSALEVVQSQETLADGNVIQRKRQTNVYRDSQGRVRTEETITPDASTGKQPYTLVTILDYVGGKRYVLNSSTMTAAESPLRAPHNPPQRTAGSAAGVVPGGRRGGGGQNAGNSSGGAQTEQLRPNVVRTTLNPQSVNGVLATGTQHSETIPAGAIGNARAIQTTRVMWVSSDLKVPVQIKSNDPRFGSTDMELTNIVQAEPSASLFVVPAGYTVKNEGGFGPRGAGGPGGPGGPRGQMRGPRPGPPAQQQ
jgi:hypothetical protein